MQTLFVVFCACLVLASVAKEKEMDGSTQMMKELSSDDDVMASPEVTVGLPEETCYNKNELAEFIGMIRKNEIRISRFFGAHKCVRRKLKANPHRLSPVDDHLVRCYKTEFIINTVVECAEKVETEVDQLNNDSMTL